MLNPKMGKLIPKIISVSAVIIFCCLLARFQTNKVWLTKWLVVCFKLDVLNQALYAYLINYFYLFV